MRYSEIYNISFPKLNISLELNRIAFQTGFSTIYWYGIILCVGFLIAYLYVCKRANFFGIEINEITDYVIFSSLSALIFARLYYVLFYPDDFYIKHPENIFHISEGGIAIYGALIGGVLAVFIISKIKKTQNIWSILDLTSLGLLIGQTIGRWGNFVNQEAFGTKTELPWGMLSENTELQTVHPCFLYESLGCLLIFISLHIYSKKGRTKPGDIFWLYLLFYGILRSLIESLRTDSLMIPYTNFKVSQILGVTLVITAIINLTKRKK